MRRGGQQFVRAVVHHVHIQHAVAVEVHHLKHVRRGAGHEVLPRGKVACSVVEEHDDTPGIPWENIVQRGVFDDVQIAIAVHVVDLASGPEGTVQQVSCAGRSLVGEVACAIVDQQKVFGRPSTAVHAVVHEVEVLRAVAREVAGPHRTNQRVVADQRGKTRCRFVRQTQPIAVGIFPEIHVEHRLLVERVHNDHIVPRVLVNIHDVDVPGKAGVGDEFGCELVRHVDQDPLLVHQKQVRLGRFCGGRKRFLANDNHVGPSVLVEVGRPDVLFLVVGIGDAREHEAFVGLDVPFQPLRLKGASHEKKDQRGSWGGRKKTQHSIRLVVQQNGGLRSMHSAVALNIRHFWIRFVECAEANQPK